MPSYHANARLPQPAGHRFRGVEFADQFMRIWDLNPKDLCRTHLLGEHRELHGLWNILTQNLRGYRAHPETRRWEGKLAALYRRHQTLVAAMERRGYRHASPLDARLATGNDFQDEFVDPLSAQRQLLTSKPCSCFFSKRLSLVAATMDLCDAEIAGRNTLAHALDAIVPASWPPPVLEATDIDRIRSGLESDHGSWTLHYLLRTPSIENEERELVGVAGYAAPPASGAVEIGYAVAVEHQRRGYATEAVRALVERAFADQAVSVVFATTFATLEPSIGVLTKAEFQRVAHHPENGIVKYERRRERP